MTGILKALLSASVPFGTIEFSSNSQSLLHLPVKVTIGSFAAGGPTGGGSTGAQSGGNGPLQGNSVVLT